MTIAAAGFRHFEVLGLAESVRSGSSGSSTHAPTGPCLTLQPSTVRCLRRMLNRPLDLQVNAFSELIWAIMKLCRQRERQQAFCQFARTHTHDVQHLLDWASVHLEATFEGHTPTGAPCCDAHALVTHWEAAAPLPPCPARSLSTIVDTSSASRPASALLTATTTATTASAAASSWLLHPDAPSIVAEAAIAVIQAFLSVWNPRGAAAAADNPHARRKLMFGSSRMAAPGAAPPGPLTPSGQWRKEPQPLVAWVSSHEADIPPGAPLPPTPPHTQRTPRCGDALDTNPDPAAAATPSDPPRHPSPPSPRKPAAGSVVSAARCHPPEAPPSDQDPQDTASLAAGTDMDDSLSVYLARQQERHQRWPDYAGSLAATTAVPPSTPGRPASPPPAPARRPSRVLSAIRNIVLPSCMRQLSPAAAAAQRAGSKASGRPGGRSSLQRSHTYSLTAGTPLSLAPSARDHRQQHLGGVQRSRSFERWIRQQAPATPTPSFTAARVSPSSDSDTTAAARTAQWVFHAVQQAADRLTPEPGADPAAAAGAAPLLTPAPLADPLPPLALSRSTVALASAAVPPPAAATTDTDAELGDAEGSAPATETAFPTTDASGAGGDSWVSRSDTQQQQLRAGVAMLRTPQHPASESGSASASSLAPSVGSAAEDSGIGCAAAADDAANPRPLAALCTQPALLTGASEAPAVALPHPSFSEPLPASSLQAEPAPLTRSDFPPSPVLARINVLPPEIMDPPTPTAGPTPTRTLPISPSMRLLRRSVGSWASDTPSAVPPAGSPPDHPASPFAPAAGTPPPVPPADSWASSLSPHNSLAGTPHQAPSPVPAFPLSTLDDSTLTSTSTATGPLSPIASSQFATLRRDSWSSDYSSQSPVAQSRAADTVFAQYQHQHQPHLHHQAPTSSSLASMRSLPQVPSRLGSRRNHLSRAASARSATNAAAAAANPLPPTDDTGDAAATAAAGDAAAAAGLGQGHELDTDTHFFSDRGTTGSADLETLDALHAQHSAGDVGALQSALSGVSEQQLARAVTLDGLLLAAQQQLSRAASAAAPLLAPPPAPPALPSASSIDELRASQQQEELEQVPSTATVPELPTDSGSGSDQSCDGRGGLSGLSVRLALESQTPSTGSSEEEEAPQTLRHFGSFTGASEPSYLSGGRLPLSRAAACYSVGQAV